jgi:hypothetical protein
MERNVGMSPFEVPVGHARFEVFTAVTMKNAVYWDINTQFVPSGDTLGLRYRAQPDNAM